MADQPVERRLTTILAADLAGYSRLTEANEERTHLHLKACLEIINKQIEAHGGRVFGTGGDSVITEFSSTGEAVRAAIAIQQDLGERNAGLNKDEQLQFRVGINIGDVMVDDGELFGDGVNIAARMESIAQPGGICISESVYALVKGRFNTEFTDTGVQEIKNIAEPVRTFGWSPEGISAAAPSRLIAHRATNEGARKFGFRKWAVAAAAIAFIAAGVGGAAFWLKSDNSQKFTNMAVDGISRVNGKPFVISLGANGRADLRINLADAGRISYQQGRWWMPDGMRFCIQFPRFAQGRELCRILKQKGASFVAAAADGRGDIWTFRREWVRAGMKITGISRATNKQFSMDLKEGGFVSLSYAGSGGKPNDQGKWWVSTSGSLCVQFTRFGSARQLCRILKQQSGFIEATAASGQSDPWHIE
ncbi:MAG: adenylate/guanylate cyclase domain-containing protein [Rhodospirillales bacterium]|nr:adenylate/guanylate cyclase domain-containing protein [Rhodospirillales bacterium]